MAASEYISDALIPAQSKVSAQPQRGDCPVIVSLGQGAEHDHHLTQKLYMVKLQCDANQAA
jgi:hypothetical protein